MVYPALFAIGYSLMLAYFLKKINRFDTWLQYLCLLPVVAGIADYLENFGIINLLLTYPEMSAAVMSATNIFSLTKSSLTTLYFICLLIVLLVFAVQKLRRKVRK